MSNYSLEQALKSLGIPFLRSQVGDRYVQEMLRKKNWTLGGETSGHIICSDKARTGDGIITALQVLLIMVMQNKPLYELTQSLHLLPQALVNLKTHNASLLVSHPEVIQAVEHLEKALKSKGRIVLRPSGTEQILRIMIEGDNESMINEYAQILCEVISKLDKKGL